MTNALLRSSMFRMPAVCAALLGGALLTYSPIGEATKVMMAESDQAYLKQSPTKTPQADPTRAPIVLDTTADRVLIKKPTGSGPTSATTPYVMPTVAAPSPAVPSPAPRAPRSKPAPAPALPTSTPSAPTQAHTKPAPTGTEPGLPGEVLDGVLGKTKGTIDTVGDIVDKATGKARTKAEERAKKRAEKREAICKKAPKNPRCSQARDHDDKGGKGGKGSKDESDGFVIRLHPDDGAILAHEPHDAASPGDQEIDGERPTPLQADELVASLDAAVLLA